MLKNLIPDKQIEGEDLFKKKWALLSKDCNPIYYRCFSGTIQEGVTLFRVTFVRL